VNVIFPRYLRGRERGTMSWNRVSAVSGGTMLSLLINRRCGRSERKRDGGGGWAELTCGNGRLNDVCDSLLRYVTMPSPLRCCRLQQHHPFLSSLLFPSIPSAWLGLSSTQLVLQQLPSLARNTISVVIRLSAQK